MRLEGILENFGEGLATGAVKLVDPVGTSLSYFDKWSTGAGYSSERSPETFHNHVYKLAYNDPDRELHGSEEYFPRTLGAISGIGLGTWGILSLYSISPILGLAAPVITGLYGLTNTIGTYIHDTFKGEKTEEPKKASFEEGFYSGWNSTTHLYMNFAHDIEGGLTGRGLDNSKIESSIKDSYKPMRRNFKSLAGSLLGVITGAIVSVASLGLVPLYKSIRDTGNNITLK